MSDKRTVRWRSLIRKLHRDIGYLCIGLTIVFATSGIALNHLRDWNPNYIVERQVMAVSLQSSLSDEALNSALTTHFSDAGKLKATYWESVNNYKLFFDGGGTITMNFARQQALYEHVKPRPVFKEFNRLHLNEAHNGWIAFSDIYAALLIFLALSALFMVKGKYSPWGVRRGWLVVLGGLIPLVYIFV